MKRNFLKSVYGKIGLMLILLLTVFAALCCGSAELSLGEIIQGLKGTEGFETVSTILYTIRLPRVLAAVVAGAGLSVSGVLLQTVTGNALASPNIIGVNSGAGFAVIITMALFPSAVYAVPVMAFAGAFGASAVIITLSSKINISKSTVVLVGIAITSLLNSGISFISYFDSDILSTYNYFSVGSLSDVSINELYIPAVIVLISIFASVTLSDKTDALMLGDSLACSLGVNVKLHRIICLVISSACAGAVVSFAGLLGFVGLVVPHISRRLTGSGTKHLIPVSALSGAILMTAADLSGRTVLSPTEVPVGIVMSFIGAPFFFYLLLRRKKDADI